VPATIIGTPFRAHKVTSAPGVSKVWWWVPRSSPRLHLPFTAIVSHGAAPLGALARNRALLFTAFLPVVVVLSLHTNLREELGWTASRSQPVMGAVLGDREAG
jgi:hypothetical protein